tara:strand:+ start:84 stop:443 length:360 start_codon:yes stop_codon:yes gene_type:complete
MGCECYQNQKEQRFYKLHFSPFLMCFSRPTKVRISLSTVSFLFSRRKVCLLFLIAAIAISLSSKSFLSASAIAKPSFLTAARTISLSFLNFFGRLFNSKPFFLTNSKASVLLIINTSYY